MLKSVMITLRGWICQHFDLIPYEDYSIAVDLLASERVVVKDLQGKLLSAGVKLERASKANAELQCKLKQVTFLEGRVQELEIALAKQRIEPKKDKEKLEPVLWSRSSWRAIAQQRSIASIPDTEPDSVKQLESKVAKET